MKILFNTFNFNTSVDQKRLPDINYSNMILGVTRISAPSITHWTIDILMVNAGIPPYIHKSLFMNIMGDVNENII